MVQSHVFSMCTTALNHIYIQLLVAPILSKVRVEVTQSYDKIPTSGINISLSLSTMRTKPSQVQSPFPVLYFLWQNKEPDRYSLYRIPNLVIFLLTPPVELFMLAFNPSTKPQQRKVIVNLWHKLKTSWYSLLATRARGILITSHLIDSIVPGLRPKNQEVTIFQMANMQGVMI